ncbi:PHB depolymerase family esterase [Streptomyces sp. NPDC086023]|uniref:extracellular catalytic domain type 2 short-chain-length polyhydroxyalkanoate depolymerase n=1 Tax=Streptomyces sp. NPDC086023 TaxID=3365746 RepID=UPI0037D2F9EE
MRWSRAARFRPLAVLLLLLGAALAPPAVAAPTGAAAAVPPAVPGELRPYDITGVYSAGVSSGGYLATQLHVAYSGTFGGSAAFASGPYGCARGSLNTALNACMDTLQDLGLDQLERTARDWSAQGLIDPVANLSGDPVYLFSGTGDTTVRQPVSDALATWYGRFGARVRYEDQVAAGHAWISPRGPNSCSVTQKPWLNDCGFDAERDLLGHLLGTVTAPAAAPGGSLIAFDQNRYATGGRAAAHSLDETGYAYVPTACADGAPCTLLVALHGCKQGYAYQGFGRQFIDGAYLNEYADTNRMVVLYPQAVPTATLDNPNGCWNWWGYLGDTAHARHGGGQIEAVMGMVRALGGGPTTPPPAGNRLVLPSVDAEDGYVKAAADGTGASVGTLEGSYGQAVGRGSDGRYNRTLLSFDTSRIPAGARVTRAYVTVTRSSGSGDPWASPAGNRLVADVRTGCFGGCGVEAADWTAAPTVAGAAVVTPFSSGSAASSDLSPAGLQALHRTGTTQVRLRFEAPQTSTAYLFLNHGTRATLTVEYE